MELNINTAMQGAVLALSGWLIAVSKILWGKVSTSEKELKAENIILRERNSKLEADFGRAIGRLDEILSNRKEQTQRLPPYETH